MAEATGNSGGEGSGGGSGVYLIGFVVIAAAIGGIVYFVTKDDGSGKGAGTATVAAAASDTAPKRMNAPAPPPPPEDIDDEPSASAATSASAAPSSSSGKGGPNSGVAGSGAGACGSCGKGKSSSALESKVSAVAGSAQGCYQRALRGTSAASGKIVVAVSVGQGGASCGASIVSDTLNDGAISSCVLGRFQSQSWPAPEEGCVTINVPINFKLAN